VALNRKVETLVSKLTEDQSQVYTNICHISMQAAATKSSYMHDPLLCYIAALGVSDLETHFSVYLQLAPGSGKTFVILLIATYIAIKKDGRKVVIVVPDQVILH
jgi:hypothetical protein